MIAYLQVSTQSTKKYMVEIIDIDGTKKTIHFGANGYSDYLKHKDFNRMKLYTDRHRKNENWTKSGIKTAGFWSKYILWNKPTMSEAIKYIEKIFNIRVIRK